MVPHNYNIRGFYQGIMFAKVTDEDRGQSAIKTSRNGRKLTVWSFTPVPVQGRRGMESHSLKSIAGTKGAQIMLGGECSEFRPEPLN